MASLLREFVAGVPPETLRERADCRKRLQSTYDFKGILAAKA
jgi:hypothetical protein